MPSIAVGAHRRSSASAAKVFAFLKDGASWPSWSMFESFELERHGRDEMLGVGAIRIFRTKISTAREEVVELVEGRRLSYVLLSGLPLRNYRADVALTPTPSGGCTIEWCASFDPQIPGTGWFWRFFMGRILARITAQVAAVAEGRGSRSTLRAST